MHKNFSGMSTEGGMSGYMGFSAGASVTLRFGLRSGLCCANALFETVFTAVTAAIQFFGAFSFLMAHDILLKEDMF